MNKLARDDRRARRARVIEICEEWKERAEEQLKGIRKEMRRTTNTDALIQSLMSLGKGTGNVVIRVFDIIKKAGGNGDRTQRSIAGYTRTTIKVNRSYEGPKLGKECIRLLRRLTGRK
eukprot:3592909-Pleurochrysis_carterae.AAC.3